ncbi:hypothetical protein F4Z99_04155 [Candidatus Poribacteria bacterium]|nr:hypothetical protein [Candidatus Poribacteria bacterium]MYB02488.1 hypothetical protein [Candidatus Poribacteria bacterium]
MYTLTYQSLVIKFTKPKALGNRIRDLIEKGVESITLTPRGIEYTTGRRLLLIGNIGYRHHSEEYPEGVTATGQHSVEVNTHKMLKFLGSDPKPSPQEPEPVRRRWITPEQYEKQKALNPTISTILL